MQVEMFPPSESGAPGGWRISGWSTVEELLEFRDQQRRLRPERQLLYILGDYGQASYTSGHAVAAHNLDVPPDGLLDERELARYENELVLSPDRWAQVVTSNIPDGSRNTQLADVVGRLRPIGELDLLGLYDAAGDVFQTPLRCLSIRAPATSLAIAAQPNGYFADDLNPFENYVLAEHLRTNFSYELLGLGAYLAAYVRSEALDEVGCREVVDSISDMYAAMDDQTAELWAMKAAGRRWFLLHIRGG